METPLEQLLLYCLRAVFIKGLLTCSQGLFSGVWDLDNTAAPGQDKKFHPGNKSVKDPHSSPSLKMSIESVAVGSSEAINIASSHSKLQSKAFASNLMANPSKPRIGKPSPYFVLLLLRSKRLRHAVYTAISL